MNSNKKKPIHLITFLIGFTQIYAWATIYYLPATLIKIVPKEIGQSAFIVMSGFSWALLVAGLSAPRIGRWIESEGGRRPLATGSMLMGLSLFMLSQTQGLLMWYAGWTVAGLGMGLGLFNAAFAALGRLFGPNAKTIIIRVTLISGFATVFWPLTTYLIAHIGWRNMMIVYAIPHFIVWAPLFLLLMPAKVPEHSELPQSEQSVVAEKFRIVFYLFLIYAILRAIVGTTVSVGILSLFTGIGL